MRFVGGANFKSLDRLSEIQVIKEQNFYVTTHFYYMNFIVLLNTEKKQNFRAVYLENKSSGTFADRYGQEWGIETVRIGWLRGVADYFVKEAQIGNTG